MPLSNHSYTSLQCLAVLKHCLRYRASPRNNLTKACTFDEPGAQRFTVSVFLAIIYLGLYSTHWIKTMKTLASLMAAAIFFIAPHAYSMRASMDFSSKNSFIPTLQANESGKAKKPKKARAKKGGGVAFYEGSAETRSERDRRLKRECKGQVNAGVCAGYTR